MNLYETDAEFMERFERFAFKEIVNENGMKLDDETRYMSILASLIGCQGVDAYKVIVAKALDSGLSPMVIKEIVYQSVDYLGMGRAWPFLVATNVVMEAQGIELPLVATAAKPNPCVCATATSSCRPPLKRTKRVRSCACTRSISPKRRRGARGRTP